MGNVLVEFCSHNGVALIIRIFANTQVLNFRKSKLNPGIRRYGE